MASKTCCQLFNSWIFKKLVQRKFFLKSVTDARCQPSCQNGVASHFEEAMCPADGVHTQHFFEKPLQFVLNFICRWHIEGIRTGEPLFTDYLGCELLPTGVLMRSFLYI